MAASPSLTPGRILGHFRLIEEIGAGGMGIVYRARDTRLERDVAVKVLNAKTLGDATAGKRFRREALILSRLNHPNVEAVYDFHSEQGIEYLVMEYVPGTSLNERLECGALPEREVLALGTQLSRGLAAAHSQRVIHRDLKPGNLRVTPDNVLKILDFGLAQLSASPDDETVSQEVALHHSLAGTPPYLAPEQVLGKEPDTRSDIYSAGVVLYEMATGSRPFRQHAQHLRDAIVQSLPPRPRTQNPNISQGLEAVILKCMEKDPKLRYQSANELLRDLELLGVARNTRATLVWTAVVLIGIIAGVLIWRSQAPKLIRQSIMAVLPMETVGQDPATSALGLGLTETVTAKLVEASDSDAVQVVSPSEIKDRGIKSAADAAREFGADMVLVSSLQRSGQTIRINCHLVNPKTGVELAAKSIEAEVSDSFGLQDKVVGAAFDMMPTKIKPEERRRMKVTQDTQPAAYEAYIRGRGYLQAYEKPENIENAIAEFQQALNIDPNYALAYAGLGNAYWTEYMRLDKGNELVAEASRNCKKALSLNPELVEGYICLGNLLNGTGQYNMAVDEFKRAVQWNGQSDVALRGLADAYTHLGKFADAESTYKKAIMLRPKYWGVYSWLGLFYFDQARYPEAAAMFLRASQLAPDNYQGYITLGGVYIAEGRYPDAIAAFQRSIDLRPSVDGHSNLGYTYFLMHRFRESIEAQEQAIKIDDGNWECWGNLADALYWSADRRAEADVTYKRAISIASSKAKINPRDPLVLAYLANYSAMIGERKAALGYLQRALDVAPSNGEVLLRAAVVYNRFNQTDKSLTYVKKATEVGYSRAIIRDSPDFANLQEDARFKSLVSNVP